MNIGESQDWNVYYNGRLDDIRMYSRALPSTEIAALAARNYTSVTWTNGTSTDYENSSNWDIGAVPDPYTLVTIGSGINQPTMRANDNVSGLTINTGSTLTLAGYNLGFNDPSIVSEL